jgi:hypothetical protein
MENVKNKSFCQKVRLSGPYDEWYENGIKKSEGRTSKKVFNLTTRLPILEPDGQQTVTDGEGILIKTDKFVTNKTNDKKWS